MKKVNLSAVTTSIGAPVKHGTIDHLQSAYTEAIESILRAAIGSEYDPTKGYILHGCEATGSDPGSRTISAGAIFFNGEVYQVPEASFTTSGSDVAVGTITTSHFTGTSADPVKFTDNNVRYIHDIRQIVFSADLAGSGDVNFDDLLPVYPGLPMFNLTGTGDATITGVYPDLNVGVKVPFAKGRTATINPGTGGSTQSVVLSPAAANTNYIVLLTLEAQTSDYDNNTVILSYTNKTVNGFDILLRETGDFTQSVKVAWALFML